MTTQQGSMYSKYCRRCGRLLEGEKSRQRGFGEGCYTKYIKEQNLQLSLFSFQSNQLLKENKSE